MFVPMKSKPRHARTRIRRAGQSFLLACCLGLAGSTAAWAADANTATVPRFQPGQLLTVKPSIRNPLPDAAENYLISYISTSFQGGNTVVYGQVSLPKSAPPPGGYPVISWGNGVTGVASQCAPSVVSSYANAYLNEWIKRGYAVLRTDYEGWTAYGPPPELNGKANATAISDIVTAAHSLTDKLSKDWVAVGHSLGGGAALFTASLDQRYKLKGAIALAPVGPGVLKFVEGVKNGEPVGHFTQQFISLTVLGGKIADPSIDLDRLVKAEMRPQVDAIWNAACVGDPSLMKFPHLKPGGYLNAGADFDKLATFLRAQDPSTVDMRAPVFIAQGLKDETTVKPDTTEQVVANLCKKGASVFYKSYAEANHRAVIDASTGDAFEFAQAVFAGQAPKSSCGR